MLSLLPRITLFLAGTVLYYGPGVMEEVVANRIECKRVAVCLDYFNPLEYDGLVAVNSCKWVGREGCLIINGEVYKVLVVDCRAKEHDPSVSVVEINYELAQRAGMDGPGEGIFFIVGGGS